MSGQRSTRRNRGQSELAPASDDEEMRQDAASHSTGQQPATTTTTTTTTVPLAQGGVTTRRQQQQQQQQHGAASGHGGAARGPVSPDDEGGDESDEGDDGYLEGGEELLLASVLSPAAAMEDDEDEYELEEESDDDAEEEEDDDEEEDGFEEQQQQEEEEEGEGVDHGVLTGSRIMSLLFGHRRHLAEAQSVLRDMPRLPLTRAPLRGDLAATINSGTRAMDIGQVNPIWGCLDTSCDAIALPAITTEQAWQAHKRRAGFTRVPLASSASADADEDGGEGPAGGSSEPADAAAAAAAAAGGRQALSSCSSLGGVLGSFLHTVTEAASPRAGACGSGGGSGARGCSAATRGAKRRSESAAAAAAAAGGEGESDGGAAPMGPRAAAGSSGGTSSSSSSSGFGLVNTASLLLKREVAMNRQAGFSRAQQQHLACHRALPIFPQKVRDSMASRAYIGQYSASGDFFIAAFQDKRVRLYDTRRNWALRKDVTTRMTRWTITDTTMSPDQRLLVYASISPVAFVVNVGSSYDLVESQANITELHEPLAFDGSQAPGADRRRGGNGSDDDDEWGGHSFGIWSISWSPQGGQLIAGTNNNSVYVYDIESKRCLTRLTGHNDDVNAVAYLDNDSPHLIISGSDDSMVRVWDTRDRRSSTNLRTPQGVLVGHTEGITHICPRGDGTHLISNCKDQTIKLWDVRGAVGAARAAESARQRPRIPRWDYRWEQYPATGHAVVHPCDASLMTYRGHAVLQTLVRAYFSPAHTTGQRYIYAGSSEGAEGDEEDGGLGGGGGDAAVAAAAARLGLGRGGGGGGGGGAGGAHITVWDVVSGKQVARLQYHQGLVRDCSWHPYEPELTSVSWDGRVVSWGPQLPSRPLPRSNRDMLQGYF